MLIRIVHMHFTEEGVEKFLVLFAHHVEAIRRSPGCQFLQLLRDVDDPLHFTTISHWDSELSLLDYRQSALFRSVWGSAKAHFSARPRAYSMEEHTSD
jgi:quinol monooxygenase YgiN